jgi:hypothetical protein
MSHLTTERLAAFADETPTPDEATHLAGCWDCRAEVAAYRRLARMSAMAPLPTEPLTAWSHLAPQLRAEGLINDTAQGGGSPHSVVVPLASVRRTPVPQWALRAAAGFALVLGGAVAGRLSTVVSLNGSPQPTDFTNAIPVSYRSPDEALRALNVAQQEYQNAAAFLASQDTSARFIGMNQDSYRARLAALDDIAATARAALYRAPQDPMLNQYYLTTLGAREATLREIGAAPAVNRRLERY